MPPVGGRSCLSGGKGQGSSRRGGCYLSVPFILGTLQLRFQLAFFSSRTFPERFPVREEVPPRDTDLLDGHCSGPGRGAARLSWESPSFLGIDHVVTGLRLLTGALEALIFPGRSPLLPPSLIVALGLGPGGRKPSTRTRGESRPSLVLLSALPGVGRGALHSTGLVAPLASHPPLGQFEALHDCDAEAQQHAPSSCPLCGAPAGLSLPCWAQSSLTRREVTFAKGCQNLGKQRGAGPMVGAQ